MIKFTPHQEKIFLDRGIHPDKILSHVNDKRPSFEALVPYLPTKVTSFLDIGCGFGGMAVHLALHYQTATCHLMDGETIDKTKQIAGWHNRTLEPWRDVYVAQANVKAHWEGKVHAYPVNQRLTIPCDLIISNFSWGFHYPVETYIPLVKRSLSDDGMIILDVKNETNESVVLSRHFSRVETLEEHLKYRRIRCFRKRA